MKLPQAIDKLFEEFINPAELEIANTMEFKEGLLYNYRVNQYFERNENTFKRMLSRYTKAGKVMISPQQVVQLA